MNNQVVYEHTENGTTTREPGDAWKHPGATSTLSASQTLDFILNLRGAQFVQPPGGAAKMLPRHWVRYFFLGQGQPPPRRPEPGDLDHDPTIEWRIVQYGAVEVLP